jgi:hypothetical protein
MEEFGTVRRRVQKLQAVFFSHFLCIFYHKGNPSLAEKKGEKHLKSSTFFSNLLVTGVLSFQRTSHFALNLIYTVQI